jgi:putative pyruvate formate lyase activating enzyme
VVSSVGPHFGEEPCLVGAGGSGTIFLAGCNLGCIYCQNYDISHYNVGDERTPDQIASLMMSLAAGGCHNINFVTPTHVTPQLMKAIDLARGAGLTLPIVWNCGGYESVEVLRLLDGFVDIYMPDFKYACSAQAGRYSSAPDYFEVAKAALTEMHRQVGDLKIRNGVAVRGVLVRHLVLPNDQAGGCQIVDFLADSISSNAFINVMGQYRPEFQAAACGELARRPTAEEIDQVRRHATCRGLRLAS